MWSATSDLGLNSLRYKQMLETILKMTRLHIFSLFISLSTHRCEHAGTHTHTQTQAHLHLHTTTGKYTLANTVY